MKDGLEDRLLYGKGIGDDYVLNNLIVERINSRFN